MDLNVLRRFLFSLLLRSIAWKGVFFSCKEVVEMLFAPHDHVVRNKLSGWRIVQLILILRKML